MQFSEAWLRNWVNPEIDTAQLTHQLTMAGLEVGSVDSAAPEFNSVVIGEVINCQPHPDADRLSVCEVSVGQEDNLQIVCGASNVKTGVRVPTALTGAVLPGNFKIKPTKLRGVASSGMLCAATELGLAEQSDGLLILPDDAPVGKDIREYLTLDDTVIEVDLTPNRADCLSIRGIAREAALLNRTAFTDCEPTSVTPAIDNTITIKIEESAACPRYQARIIKGVKPFAETPLWMQERLRRSGLRSLGAVVDITNYVLLELGQPLHAFDLNKISGSIVVRFAKPEETLTLLNDQQITMDNNTLVIADQDTALALAGVMGGAESAVSESTSDILLECAFFNPTTIMGKARAYGLHTDSSHRFERGVDPELQQLAIEYASDLFVSIAGGQVGPVCEVKSDQHLPKRDYIQLRRQRLYQILGTEFDDNRVAEILTGLGMTCTANEAGWLVMPPSFRFDLAIEADLVEEIARVYGYDQLPKRQIVNPAQLADVSESSLSLDRIKDILVDRDYQEAITFSFADSEQLKKFEPGIEGRKLKNPISSELSTMRTSLWPGLIQAVQYNMNRQQDRVRLFESGLKFNNAELLEQTHVLAGVITGNVHSLSSHGGQRNVDFYDIKADVEAIFGAGRHHQVEFRRGQHAALHPGQTAFVYLDGSEQAGILGMLHPQLATELDLEQNTFVFEIKLSSLLNRIVPKFGALSRFPTVRRDLALIVKDEIPADNLVNAILESEHELINNVTIFDVYHGKGVESGYKSLALALILQDKMKTLADHEIDAIVTRVIDFLKKEFNASLRH